MFFFPISDVNATKKKPVINWVILISCILIFIYQKNLGYHFEQSTILSFGMIPSVLFNIKQLPNDLTIIPSSMTLISSMFLHGGWMHLIGNMTYLYIFGDNIEDKLQKLKDELISHFMNEDIDEKALNRFFKSIVKKLTK